MDKTILILRDGRKYYREFGYAIGARVEEVVQAIQTRLGGTVERTMHMDDCFVAAMRVNGQKITVYWEYSKPNEPFIEVRAGSVEANKLLEEIYWAMGPYSSEGGGVVTR